MESALSYRFRCLWPAAVRVLVKRFTKRFRGNVGLP